MCDEHARLTVTHVVSVTHTRSHVVFSQMTAQVAREQIAERIQDAERERMSRDARWRAHRQEVNRVRASVLLLPRINRETRREA